MSTSTAIISNIPSQTYPSIEARTDPSTSTHMQRCFTLLSQTETQIANLEWKATAFKILAVFTAVLSAALTAGIFYATIHFTTSFAAQNLFDESVVTLIMGSLFGVPFSLVSGIFGVLDLKKRAEMHEKSARIIKDIQQEFQSSQVQDNLLAAVNVSIASGVDVAASDIDSFKPILTFYNYYQSQYLEKCRCEREHVAAALATDSLETRCEHYAKAYKCRQDSLVYKVAAAFTVAVMQNPDCTNEVPELCTLTRFDIPIHEYALSANPDMNTTTNSKDPWFARVLCQEYNDPLADQCIVFKNNTIPALSSDYIQTQSIRQIAQRMLDATHLPVERTSSDLMSVKIIFT